MAPEGLYGDRGRIPPWLSGRPYVPQAREPESLAAGRTQDWSAVLAQMAREAHEHEAALAAERAGPGHARPSLAAAAVRRARRAACTVLTVAGLLLIAAGKRAAGEASR